MFPACQRLRDGQDLEARIAARKLLRFVRAPRRTREDPLLRHLYGFFESFLPGALGTMPEVSIRRMIFRVGSA